MLMTRVGSGAAALVLVAGGLLVAVGAPAQAQEATCQGQPATIVATADGELAGTDGDDVIDAGDFDVIVHGGAGDDLICANAGHGAQLFGDDGDDTLVDRPGTGTGRTLLEAGPGADHFIGVTNAHLSSATEVSFLGRPAGVVVDLAAGTAVDGPDTDTLSGIHAVVGTRYADTFTGTADADYYDSGAEPAFPAPKKQLDVVRMGAGDDSVEATFGTIHLGPGDDQFEGARSAVEGGTGADDILLDMGGTGRGGPGADTISASANYENEPAPPSSFTVDGGPGDDLLSPIYAFEQLDEDCPRLCARGTLSGGPGVDTLQLEVKHSVVDLASGRVSVWGGRSQIRLVENVLGSPRADIIRGDGGPNRFDGGGGADRLSGRGGRDVLRGDAGKDEATGGPGHDRCSAEIVHSC